MSSDIQPLSHGYGYYSPYYYSDWYYNTPGSGSIGAVTFIIFIMLILWVFYWVWGDDEGCSMCTSKKSDVRKKPRPSGKPPLHPRTKRVLPQTVQPVLEPKPSSPPAQLMPKAKVQAVPYKPINRFEIKRVVMNTSAQGWNQNQIDLVNSMNNYSFFTMVRKEIVNKLKSKRNPVILAKQLIALRMQLKPDELNVVLLSKYINIGINVIQASDISKISKKFHNFI